VIPRESEKVSVFSRERKDRAVSRLRFYLLAILAWAFIFYNTERLFTPINLASFVYGLAAVYALIVIMYSPIYRISPVLLFFGSLIPYFALKVSLGYPIGGENLPLTVTEIVSLGITLFLSWQIGFGLETLRREILRLTIGSANMTVNPFQSAQAEFYREIRRARHYSRPVAILSISPTSESVELSINRFLQEAQNNIIRQYVTARTAEMLRTTLKETDAITTRNNHFIVLLPETEFKHLPAVIGRLKDTAQEKLGLTLKIGASTFPDDALTFESLVRSAEERMKMEYSGDSGDSVENRSNGGHQKSVAHQTNNELNKADVADVTH
jgi:hypothetical protein